MAILELALLGPCEAFLDQQQISGFRTRTVQALLAYLAIESRSPLGREFLSELLWPGLPPGYGRKNLRQSLYELRKLLPEVSTKDGDSTAPLLLADRQTIQINPQSYLELDVAIFEGYIDKGTVESLREGVGIYRGDFLEGFYLPDNNNFEAWVLNKRTHYRRLFLDSLNRLAQISIENGWLEQAEAYARQQMEHDDLREPAVHQLMVALALRGQKVAALTHYERFTERVEDALNVSPGPELAELYRHIQEDRLDEYLNTATSERAQTRTPRNRTAKEIEVEKVDISKEVVQHNLPVPSTPFVGRRGELDALGRLLKDDGMRCLTLLGPGGSGKTRLAIQAAEKVQDAFPDGVWFTPLAGINDPSDLVSAIAKALDFTLYEEKVEPKKQLLSFLRNKQLLLVLDNYEQLLTSGGAQLSSELMAGAPHIKLMVTSRTRLNIQSESLFIVRGMRLPKDGTDLEYDQVVTFSAVQLFEQSARQVAAGFDLSRHLASVIAICRTVEGMPLGIELAAAWVELLSPAEIVVEVQRSLDFLETELQDVPSRQRSMRAVFDYSWRMLAPREKLIFKKLSAFRGGFTREAAEVVASATLRDLMALVHKSLLRREVGGRFQIHELLRQYAAEPLSRDTEAEKQIHATHSNFYLSFLQSQGELLKGPEMLAPLNDLAADLDNIRSAWSWGTRHGLFEQLDDTLAALFIYYSTRKSSEEVPALLQETIEKLQNEGSDENQIILARLLILQGWSHSHYFYRWEHKDLLRSTMEIIESSGTPERVGFLYSLLGLFLYTEQDQDSFNILEESVEVARQSGDIWAEAVACIFLSECLVNSDDHFDLARACLDEAIELSESISNPLLIGRTLSIEANLAAHLENFDESKTNARQARKIFLELGDQINAMDTLWLMGHCTAMSGHHAEAARYFAESQAFFNRQGIMWEAHSSLSWKSIEESRKGDYATARQDREACLAQSLNLDDTLLVAWNRWELGEILRLVGEKEAALGNYEAAFKLFIKHEHRLGFAFYHRGLGQLALMEKEYDQATRQFVRCRELAFGEKHGWTASLALSNLGWLAILQGDLAGGHQLLIDALQVEPPADRGLRTLPLVGLAAYLAATGQSEKAVAVATFVQGYFAVWQETKDQALAIIAQVKNDLSPDQFRAAEMEGQDLTYDDVIERWLTE